MEGQKVETRTLENVLRNYALGLPETYEEFPWGHRALKVRGKTFMFMNAEPGELSFSVKLPRSKEFALSLPFTAPTGYGLGKSGWVSSRLTVGDSPSLEMLRSWVDESYRAIAPKKLVAQLADSPPRPAEPTRTEVEDEPRRSRPRAGRPKQRG